MRGTRHRSEKNTAASAGRRRSDIHFQQGRHRRHGTLLRGIQTQPGLLRGFRNKGDGRFRENRRLPQGPLP